MKTLIRNLITTLHALAFAPTLRTRDNEAPMTAVIEAESLAVVSIDNETEPGRPRFTVPYGSYPTAENRDVLQVFNKSAAKQMQGLLKWSPTAWIKSVWKNGWHKVLGPRPVLIGHPLTQDNEVVKPGMDATAYGSIYQIDVHDNEAVFHFAPTPEGLEIMKKYKSGSPSWKCFERGNESLPFALLSFGFTNTPNIAAVTLDNEAAALDVEAVVTAEPEETRATEQDNEAKQWQRDLRSKLYLDADASPEQVLTAIASREAEINRMRADVAAFKAQLADEQGRVATMTTSIANNEAMITTLREQDNERTTTLEQATTKHEQTVKALAAAVAEAAVMTGRIAIAERDNEANTIATAATPEAITAAAAALLRKPQRYRTTPGLAGVAGAIRTATLNNEITNERRKAEAKAEKVRTRQADLMRGGMRSDLAFTQAHNEAHGINPAGI